MEVKGEISMLENRDLTKKGAYFMSCFVASLRVQKDCKITLGKEVRDP